MNQASFWNNYTRKVQKGNIVALPQKYNVGKEVIAFRYPLGIGFTTHELFTKMYEHEPEYVEELAKLRVGKQQKVCLTKIVDELEIRDEKKVDILSQLTYFIIKKKKKN